MALRGISIPFQTRSVLKSCAQLGKGKTYLVGGAVRDLLLGKNPEDLDIACFNPEELSRSLQKVFGGTLVALDEQNGIFRIVFPKARFAFIRQVDLSLIQGHGIDEDLARRDFTINAMAIELSENLGARADSARVLDPFKGRDDLTKKIVRCPNKAVLADDPLRLLRAFRIAAQLNFRIEPKTLRMIASLSKLATKPAAERIKTEILGIFSAPHASHWARLMDETSVLTRVFPEMEKTRKCAEVYYGQGGVLTHSLATLERMDFLLERLNQAFPKHAGKIRSEIESNNFGDAPYAAFLRLCAFLHDLSKPAAAKTIEGRLRFFRHDEIGAETISIMLNHMRFSRDVAQAASVIVAHHLRPGNLAANNMVSDKAAYRFFRDVGQQSLGLLLTCWADHASYIPQSRLLRHLNLLCQPPGTLSKTVREDEKKTIRHLQVVSLLMGRLLDEKNKAVPDPVIDGRDVMKALGIKPGPDVGAWLERVREAQARHKIATREEALSYLAQSKKKRPRSN